MNSVIYGMVILFLSAVSPAETPIFQEQSVSVRLPLHPLHEDSLEVAPSKERKFSDWTKKNHSDSYAALQKIRSTWDQYLIIGQQSQNEPFRWEAVPYQTPTSKIERIWQKIRVFFRVIFGGITLTDAQKEEKSQSIPQMLANASVPPPSSYEKGEDAFCRDSVIKRQLIFEGDKMRILYNWAPLPMGGDQLHFMVIPKEHKVFFHELSEEEYVEAAALTKQLIDHFSATRSIRNVSLHHKSGTAVGQTQPHWHLHVIFSQSQKQEVLSVLRIVKNLFTGGSSPLKPDALKERVNSLSKEFKQSEVHE